MQTGSQQVVEGVSVCESLFGPEALAQGVWGAGLAAGLKEELTHHGSVPADGTWGLRLCLRAARFVCAGSCS